jgi:tRNA A-37 threonylcarbamoyl transferase component Bud32
MFVFLPVVRLEPVEAAGSLSPHRNAPMSSAGKGDPDALLAWACTELRRQLEQGVPARAETFLEAHPTLASSPERALGLILTEFETRRRLGDRPSPSEWLSRFPRWSERLRRELAALDEPTATATDAASEPATEVVTGRARPTGTDREGDWPVLARHVILTPIGQGGMGVVYKARDTMLGREVALKMLSAGALADALDIERFYREARATARVRHRHVMPILHVGLYDGRHCFTMPLIPGGSLATRLAEYTERPRAVAELLAKVARGVQALHEQGIVHRDLKPGNIMLDEDGEPLVSDFGLAKLSDAGAELTRTGQVMGTPAYMSPEQAAGRTGQVGPASDVWSLGVILYRLLTGQLPFADTGSDKGRRQVLLDDPPRPCRLRPDVPRDLEAICLKCLEKASHRRYATAAALADDLERWLTSRPVQATLPSRWRQLGRTVRRHPVRWAMLALLLALLATAPLFRPTPAPEDEVKKRQRQLSQGETVTLVAATAEPVHGQWVAGKGTLETHLHEAEGALTLASMSLALFELLPAQPLPAYRLRAQVRHLDSAAGGRIGLYLLHRSREAPRGREHLLVDYTFNDHDLDRPRNIGLQSRLYLPRTDKESDNQTAGPLPQPLTVPPRARKVGDWHDLEVRVTQRSVLAFRNGQRVQEWPRPALDRDFRSLFDEAPPGEVVEPLTAQGGVGLFVYRGTAAFRNVVIEPFAEQE